MARHTTKVGTLTIGTGAGVYSNVISKRELGLATGFLFHAPVAFTGTVSVHAGPNVGDTSSTVLPLSSGGTAVVIVGALSTYWAIGGFNSICLKTSGTEAAPRVVQLYAILDIPG